MILIIDNYDSFTYNLFQYISEFEQNVVIYKNDEITISKIKKMNCSHIIISPGPGVPSNAGICVEVVKYFYTKLPILGICLGHQVIGTAFKCNIKKHDSIIHGKTSIIHHDKTSMLYNEIPDRFEATRYHSLVIDRESLKNQLKVNSWLNDQTIMGVEHVEYPTYGVQFHPESVKTEHGKKMIRNFLDIV